MFDFNQMNQTHGRGGRRAGAGRKKGSQVRRSQEIVARVAAAGISPLEVILTAMRRAFQHGDLEKAAAFAKDAAPYLHPKLQAVQHSGDADQPVQTVLQIITGVARSEDSIVRREARTDR
jgi:hypothetical protein